jgi:hypothetical protein
MDSSESPTYGEQEGSAYNGHFGRTCYHPLFVVNKLGDLECSALRPGNVHSADGWHGGTGTGRVALPGQGDAVIFSRRRGLRQPEDLRVPRSRRHGLRDSVAIVGFIVTNLARPAKRVVAVYNQRGTAEQWIKEGKGAIKWTRLSCRTFAANAVRLQLHVLAYNLGNFMRALAMPKAAESWSLTGLREKLIKIGARVVSHGRYLVFEMAQVVVTGADVPRNPHAYRPAADAARTSMRGAGIESQLECGESVP